VHASNSGGSYLLQSSAGAYSGSMLPGSMAMVADGPMKQISPGGGMYAPSSMAMAMPTANDRAPGMLVHGGNDQMYHVAWE
jgi:hypothetical protein